MVRKGGFELRYHVDNTQLIDSASGVKAQNPYNPVPIVRLLYDFLSAAVRRITQQRLQYPTDAQGLVKERTTMLQERVGGSLQSRADNGGKERFGIASARYS
jgi:hypothetical protein